MSGAFDQEFAGTRRARPKGEPDPSVIAAASDRPAEAAVIGAMLRDDALVDIAADKLSAQDFSDHLFAEVYSCILSMVAKGETASAITVARRLDSHPDLAERGGAKYLAQLAASDTADRGKGYIDHLLDLSRRRYIATAISEVRPALLDTGKSLTDSVGQLEWALSSALLGSTSLPAISFADAWNAAIERVRDVRDGKEEVGAKIAGLLEWNELTGGHIPGNFILLGGRPAMGKTILAQAISRGAAEAGQGVLFISREMRVDELMIRFVADMLFAEGSSATADDVRLGRLNASDFARAERIAARVKDWPFAFEQPDRLNAAMIGPMVRRHQRALAAKGYKLNLVVIDYLGLLDPPSGRANREQEVSEISRTLKSVARSTGTTVLALSQLSRAVESREDKRPQTSDLRDSGSLEQDADIVVFVYRAQEYLDKCKPAEGTAKYDAWEIDAAAERGRLDIIAAKVRHGPPQTRKVYFFRDKQAVRPASYFQDGGWGMLI